MGTEGLGVMEFLDEENDISVVESEKAVIDRLPRPLHKRISSTSLSESKTVKSVKNKATLNGTSKRKKTKTSITSANVLRKVKHLLAGIESSGGVSSSMNNYCHPRPVFKIEGSIISRSAYQQSLQREGSHRSLKYNPSSAVEDRGGGGGGGMGSLPAKSKLIHQYTSDMKLKSLSFSFLYLEFTSKLVESNYRKHSAIAKECKFTALLVIPYLCLLISSTAFEQTSSQYAHYPNILLAFGVVDAVTLLTMLCTIFAIRKLQIEHSQYTKQSLGSKLEAIRTYFSVSLLGLVSERKSTRGINITKVIWVERYATFLELVLIIALSLRVVGVSVANACFAVCAEQVPLIPLIFLWLLPLHLSVITTIRWTTTCVFEMLSKFAILIAFFATLSAELTSTRVIQIVSALLFWFLLWFPFLYLINSNMLRRFQESEGFVRVIDHYSYLSFQQDQEGGATAGWESLEADDDHEEKKEEEEEGADHPLEESSIPQSAVAEDGGIHLSRL